MAEASLALGIAGIVASTPSLIDACVRYIHFLKEVYNSYKKAEKAISGLILGFQAHLSNVEDALAFLKELAPTLKPEVETQLTDILEVLRNEILKRAVAKMRPYKDGIPGGLSRWQRFTFASSQKSVFAAIAADLERWVDQFKNRLYFLALSPSNFITLEELDIKTRSLKARSGVEAVRELFIRGQRTKKPNVLLPADQIPASLPDRLPFSEIRFNGVATFVETKYPPPTRPVDATASSSVVASKSSKLLDKLDAETLASILNASEPGTTSILNCRGYYPEGDVHRLVFSLPPGLERPRTLRDLLIADREKDLRHPINDRFRLARKIGSSVLFVHSAGLVHKNIRPDNILIFETIGAEREEKFPRAIGYPFLIGFDYARREKAYSDRVSDNVWWKDIYRHPQRQGQYPDEMYSMLHDVYSLGVVLLEIALWSPFVVDQSHLSPGAPPSTQIRQPEINPDLDHTCNISQIDDSSRRVLRAPTEILNTFKETAKREIPRNMGQRYYDVVLRCLQCVDGGEGGPEEPKEGDGISVGAVYVENILSTLEEITV
ncbi:MAG: hypothetical protein M1839_003485 [Geoglossum umbratile]|nr:MAG: hypothetical protein M1839_003485 [Geoglossum umbratile]